MSCIKWKELAGFLAGLVHAGVKLISATKARAVAANQKTLPEAKSSNSAALQPCRCSCRWLYSAGIELVFDAIVAAGVAVFVSSSSDGAAV